MSNGSDDTLTHLESLVPELQPLAFSFVRYWRQRGVPLVVISGRRTELGNQEVNGAPRSLHLEGLAMDVSIFWPGYGHLRREWIPFWWWQALAEPWERAGGRWGGRFNAPDVNHFDVGAPVSF